MIKLHGRQWVEDIERNLNRRKRRRRNRIKARRLIVRADCLNCRLEYLPQLDTNETFGVSATKRYQPFDNYICRECRWYMRGGAH